jgi:hypothetical protein
MIGRTPKPPSIPRASLSGQVVEVHMKERQSTGATGATSDTVRRSAGLACQPPGDRSLSSLLV